MWQKADPRGLRVWVTKNWPVEWYAVNQKQSSSMFVEDIVIRETVESFYTRCAIAKVVIRKSITQGEVLLFTAKAASILWKDNEKLKKFEALLKKKTGKVFSLVVKEVRVPELSAKIMAEFAASQLETRVPYRRVAKGVLQKVMEKGAVWVKIQVWWRLGGVDLSRSESFTEWRIPLQTLRADIDYHYTTAYTKYWILWLKVWICNGESIGASKKKNAMDKI